VSAAAPRRRTDERIVSAALARFAGQGFGATSLDVVAADVGLTKQAILYWFPSKEALLDAVVTRSAEELRAALDAALSTPTAPPSAPSRPPPPPPAGLERVDVVMQVVFRFAVRRPELLGLLREAGRLPGIAADLAVHMRPLVERAVAFLAEEMEAGTIRQADPRVLLAVMYATVVGVATEVEAQRAVGIEPSVASLRRLRRELFAYVRHAVAR
jgi:AcrR family transcriptional regulator